jgi:Holliday junction resolvase RusA-like endonuclease
MISYAKVVVLGSPITKSNFKLHNTKGRAILPNNSGKYNDRYALYEQEIAYTARLQNPDIVLQESLIAILKVYYKSEKRHPDTINITKSIFDGIEKSGLIVNDAQIVRILIEEYFDKENPRFELELYGESAYSISYSIEKKQISGDKKLYSPIQKNPINKANESILNTIDSSKKICSCCKKEILSNDFISANKGKTIICSDCFKKLY